MEAVIFMGVQGAGKSTFYRERFFDRYMRISLDLLRTRHRQQRFLELCLATQQRFVIDNTNSQIEERALFIAAAKAAGFRIIGYFFQTSLTDALRRNAQRTGTQQIPAPGVVSTFKRFQMPTLSEGFDELHVVTIGKPNEFVVSPWTADAPAMS